MPGVDIVTDLNKTLPFQDGVAEAVLACHSLEHLDNFEFTMSEIFRVRNHGAIVMILAPYYNTGTNIANPYHKIPFNENTFQFFNNYPSEIIDVQMEEYYRPLAPNWGLGKSDKSECAFTQDELQKLKDTAYKIETLKCDRQVMSTATEEQKKRVFRFIQFQHHCESKIHLQNSKVEELKGFYETQILQVNILGDKFNQLVQLHDELKTDITLLYETQKDSNKDIFTQQKKLEALEGACDTQALQIHTSRAG